MRVLLKTAACEVAYRSGLLRAAMRRGEPEFLRAPGGRFQILVYHRVGVVADAYVQGLSVAVFERHVRWLRRHFRILSLTKLLEAAAAGDVPARAIGITFDDGYEDTYLHVYPVLRRYEVPATVYLTTGLVDTGEAMWNDRVAAAFRDSLRPQLEPIIDRSPLSLSTPVQREAALRRTVEALKRRSPEERELLVRRIIAALRAPQRPLPRMLGWSQIDEMHRAGIEFGAHTVHHPILTSVDREAARREIVDSKRAIEERLQTPVRHFAYPNGSVRDFDEETKALVKQAGFLSATTTILGVNTAHTDRFELRRGGPWEEETAVFATKLWWYRTKTGVARRESDRESTGVDAS